MLQVRKASDRGHANHGWLDAWHSFSFSTYFDPKYTKFHSLRVLNEDIIQPETGFALHPHQNMEILTYVESGKLEHKDNQGNGSLIRAGEIQLLSAGKGIMHSEFNPSATDPCHMFQLWITPSEHFIEPSCTQKSFPDDEPGLLTLLASQSGRNDSLHLHQDADLFHGTLRAGQELQHSMPLKRAIWLQMLSGSLALGPLTLCTGDGVGISHERHMQICAIEDASFLLLDLA